MSVTTGENELSKFSDPPGDASLDDLFQPEDQAAEASTSASTSNFNHSSASITDAGKNDLATKLRATIAQKKMENEMEPANSGGNLLRIVMGYLKDDVIDMHGLVCLRPFEIFVRSYIPII